MRVVLMQEDGGSAVLTDEHEAASPGRPVLVVEAADVRGVFRPRDLITGPGGEQIHAVSVVMGWASEDGRLPEELAAAHAFVSQLAPCASASE
ncbi:MAG: hypothetical protein KA072_11260 [Thermoanaerobaculaceae bacterium]|nr:hypothetical protein [Thermoanaerobaculaceae bacterium]MDI9621753.1 hypothetical protein [Acidobacteriota bacterium]NLH12543.1 hypothetical protein [Holophagae bacterium]HPW56008.1 hypothetical protein [Thermoanaerobaculaceae bacterium]